MKSAKDFGGNSFSEKFALFINTNKRILIFGSIALLVIIAGFSVFYGISNKKSEAGNLAAESIQRNYIEWFQEADEDAKNQQLEELKAEIESAIKDYPKSYAEQRALFTKGQLALEEEEWGVAYEAFYAIAEKFPNSYLASLSCLNAAKSSEMNDDIESAQSAFLYLLENFSESAEAPEACFNLARLYEQQNDIENALKYYNMVLSDFSESSWKNLAQTRIIILDI